MCPEAEITFRVSNQLIHKIEEGKFMVKEYQRPAADKTDHSAVSSLLQIDYRFNRGIKIDHTDNALIVAISSGIFGS